MSRCLYQQRTLMEQFFTNVTVENIYFLDHDAVRLVIEKIYVDYYINL